MTGCNNSIYSDSISGCVDTVLVRALFEPGSAHYWEIEDPFGNLYTQPFTADENGHGSIDTTLLPPGFCNPGLPRFSLRARISEVGAYEDLIFLEEYAQVTVKVKGGTAVKDFVGAAISIPGFPPIDTREIYYGVKASDVLLTIEQIEASTAKDFVPAHDIIVPFNTQAPGYLWLAYPASEAGITNYYINEFDYGPLGETGTFAMPVQIGSLLFIQSNYPTEIQNVQFKH